MSSRICALSIWEIRPRHESPSLGDPRAASAGYGAENSGERPGWGEVTEPGQPPVTKGIAILRRERVNLLALAGSAGLRPRLLTGFVDHELNELLGLDGVRERTLALLALGQAEPAPTPPRLEQLVHEVAALSRRELDFSGAQELHESSSFAGPEEVERYRGGLPAVAPEHAPPAEGEPLERVVERRISVRDFAREPVEREALAQTLRVAAAPIPADVAPASETFLIANAVDGLVPGTYQFRPPGRFELLRAGDFRAHAAYLCLEQPLGGRAAATVFWVADLERVIGALGDRGYGPLQLEGGVRAGHAQLAAYASGLAAVASTFYDEEVERFLCPGRSPLLCVAIGRR